MNKLRKCAECPTWTQAVCRHAFGKFWGDKVIFGGGYLLSERAAAERAVAHKWQLSPREIAMQKMLGVKTA